MKIPLSHSAIRNLAWWFIASLLAIVFLESNALLGLALAVTSGIILGVLLFLK